MKHLTVKLEQFEGPFDLLYHLIEKNEIDIYDIPISELTEQYIEFIDKNASADMEFMSSFLLMAATLLLIKSKMLLPKIKNDEEDSDVDPREELVNKLIEYKRYKMITEQFKDKEKTGSEFIFKAPEKNLIDMFTEKQEVDLDLVLEGITVEKLYLVFQEVIKRRELKTDKIRSGFNSISKDTFTIDDKIQQIQNLLMSREHIYFDDIFDEDAGRNEIVIIFLAMLELIKMKQIKITQDKIFDNILISSFS